MIICHFFFNSKTMSWLKFLACIVCFEEHVLLNIEILKQIKSKGDTIICCTFFYVSFYSLVNESVWRLCWERRNKKTNLLHIYSWTVSFKVRSCFDLYCSVSLLCMSLPSIITDYLLWLKDLEVNWNNNYDRLDTIVTESLADQGITTHDKITLTCLIII